MNNGMTERKDKAYMAMSDSLSTLSTCPRRNVGCIAVDSHGRIIGHGFNGVPRGWSHCIDVRCPAYENDATCYAIHAEMNMLANCQDVMNIHTVYCTCQPCFNCAKALANTSIKRLVYSESIDDTGSLVMLEGNRVEIRVIC